MTHGLRGTVKCPHGEGREDALGGLHAAAIAFWSGFVAAWLVNRRHAK